MFEYISASFCYHPFTVSLSRYSSINLRIISAHTFVLGGLPVARLFQYGGQADIISRENITSSVTCPDFYCKCMYTKATKYQKLKTWCHRANFFTQIAIVNERQNTPYLHIHINENRFTYASSKKEKNCKERAWRLIYKNLNWTGFPKLKSTMSVQICFHFEWK